MQRLRDYGRRRVGRQLACRKMKSRLDGTGRREGASKRPTRRKRPNSPRSSRCFAGVRVLLDGLSGCDRAVYSDSNQILQMHRLKIEI
jgi:hypothetical protein